MKKFRRLLKNRPLIIFILLVFAIGALVAIGYGKDSGFPFLQEEKQSIQVEMTGQTSEIILPVALGNQNVSAIYLGYNFSGPIKEVKTVDNGREIILDTSEKDLPRFLITNEVGIFRINSTNKQVSPAKIADVKPGIQVSISTTYDLKTRVWVTRTVHIVD